MAWEEFLAYYSDVSLSIDNDVLFVVLFRLLFGAASSTLAATPATLSTACSSTRSTRSAWETETPRRSTPKTKNRWSAMMERDKWQNNAAPGIQEWVARFSFVAEFRTFPL